MLRTSRFTVSAALVLAAAAGASADDYRRYFVPDYDQVRGAIFDVQGLPNNGSMYCVPTAAMNWMSYIAKRGFPLVPPGPDDFGPDADTDAYNELTSWLEVLGNEMGTSATGGTGGEGAEAGITAFLESGAAGQFSVIRCYVSDEFCPPPSHLAFHAITGGLVMQRIGWYESASGVNAFDRTGGHVVSLNGLDDYDTSTPTMRWRDPGSDEGNMFFQSDFTTNSSDTQQVDGTFDGLPRTQYRLTGYNSPAFIDGYIAIRPKFVVLPNPGVGGLDFVTPDPVTPGPQYENTLAAPSTGPIVCFGIGWDQLTAIAAYDDPTTGMTGMARYTLATPDEEPVLIALLLPAVQKVREAASRTTCIHSGSQILQYEISERGEATLLASTPTAMPITDFEIAQDIIALTASGEVVLFDDGGQLGILGRYPLPNAGALDPDASVDQLPGGGFVVFSGCDVFIYGLDATGAAVLADQFDACQLTGAVGPIKRGQVLEDGTIVMSIGGSLHAVAEQAGPRGSSYATVATSFSGMAAGDQWHIAESASNFDPAVHTGPAWNDVFPTEFPGQTTECPWDLDRSGVTDFNDLNIILENWGDVGFVEDPGDANGDGAVNFDDLNLILNHWGETCG